MRCRVRLPIFLATLLVAISSWPSFAGGRDSKVPPPIAFVGELIGIKQLNYDCGTDCWDFDAGYELQYRVLREVSGKTGQETVKVDFFGHMGLLPFAYYPHALIFMYRMDDGNLMARYLAYPVWRTIDGKWGYCGDPYWNGVPKSARKFHRLKFESPIAFSTISDQWRDDDDSSIADKMRPGRRQCWRGVDAEDIVPAMLPLATPGYRRIVEFAPKSK